MLKNCARSHFIRLHGHEANLLCLSESTETRNYPNVDDNNNNNVFTELAQL